MKRSVMSKCLATTLILALMGSGAAIAAPASLDELLE